ncbi:tail tape measure protein [Sphingomicrobium arenosum]|uniref:tail tape measure protein n=1 Tax=Sphingomicrobium arenosum TaxID=2233861 RepID=UPI00223EFB9B|nr:tail tape measure protein [Sphingomicrobium arenosum]
MAEELDELVVRVRADTRAVKSELDAVRRDVEGPFAAGLDQLGGRLEAVLARAVRRGKFGFDDLKKAALSAMNSIAAASLRALIPSGQTGGINLGSLLGAALGLPGRATGGPVSAKTPYLVGERGPEMFVPEQAGRIVPSAGGQRANVAVSIKLDAPREQTVPQALSSSRRQLAAALGRAVRGA